MRLIAATVASLFVVASASAYEEKTTTAQGSKPMPTLEDVRTVAPALEKYAQRVVLGDIWKRPGLSPRDRSMVTLAAMIARNQTVELPYHLNLALDNGVKPGEVSEIITHLAFYSGWANAMSAVAIAKDVFTARNIGADQLPPASGPQLPLDEAAEEQRATRVAQLFGDVAQINYHLNRAMDSGLTREQAGEVITHLAFYAGWPNVFSALPVVKEVVEKRPR